MPTRPKHARVERVSIRLIAGAALAALFVLVTCGNAFPDDSASRRAAAARAAADERALETLALLAPRAQPDRSERIARARALISKANRRRLSRLGSRFMETALSLAGRASPNRILSGVRDLAQGVDGWGSRTDDDRRALLLLEREVRNGSTDPELLSLYEDLVARWRSDGESLLFRDYEAFMQRTGLGKLRVLVEGSEASVPLRSGSDYRFARAWFTEPADAPSPARDLAPGELRLATYLLAGNYERAGRAAAPSREASLARAVALYLSGRESIARGLLGSLLDQPDAAGELARGWLAGRLLDPGERFERAARSHRLNHALFWLGGNGLERDGAEVSGASYRAWKSAAQPFNLALSMPARILRGSTPEALSIRTASREYLVSSPSGEHARVAEELLIETEPGELERSRGSVWHDGRLVLPRARTAYRSLLAPPVMITRELLEASGLLDRPRLRLALGDGQALLLRTVSARRVAALGGLEPDAARSLVLALAQSVDQERARVEPGERGRFRGESRSAARAHWRIVALGELQRLDAVLARGSGLTLATWSSQPETLSDRAAGTVDFIEGKLDAEQSLFSTIGACPARALCLDKRRSFATSLYADSGDGFRLGARTEFRDASFSIELVDLWPRVSLVIPISRWLWVDRWFEFEAHLGAGLGGVSAVPSFPGASTTSENFED